MPRHFCTAAWTLLRVAFLLLLTSGWALAADPKAAADAELAQVRETCDYLIDLGFEMGWEKFLIYTGVYTAGSLLLLWPLSKAIAGEEGTFKNSAVYILQTTFVGFVVLGMAIYALRQGHFKALAGLGLAAIIACVVMARKSFDISTLRAIGLVICSGLLSGVVAFGAEFASGPLPFTEFERKTPEEQQQAIAEWRAKKKKGESDASAAASATAASTAPTQAPALQELYAKLQKARAELDPNDQAAVAKFNEQVAVYNAVKAAAALPPTAPVPAVVPKATTPEKKKPEPKKRET